MKRTRLVDPFKAQVFVQHVQNHLDNGEYPLPRLLKGDGIPNGQVGCKICDRGIEEIFIREEAVYDAKGREGESRKE